MLSGKKVLATMAALAMLALPASALAHDRNRDEARPYSWHDQGWHRGWMHQHGWQDRGWYGGRMQRPGGWYGGRMQRPGGWNVDRDGDHDDGYRRTPYGSYLPQSYPPPASYGRSQSLSWLMQKRYNTMRTIAALRARGDSKGAARLVPIVKSLNQRIGGLNSGYGYNGGYGYSGGANYAPPYYGAPSDGASYYGAPDAGYGVPYTGNPTLDAIGSVAAPFLFGMR